MQKFSYCLKSFLGLKLIGLSVMTVHNMELFGVQILEGYQGSVCSMVKTKGGLLKSADIYKTGTLFTKPVPYLQYRYLISQFTITNRYLISQFTIMNRYLISQFTIMNSGLYYISRCLFSKVQPCLVFC